MTLNEKQELALSLGYLINGLKSQLEYEIEFENLSKDIDYESAIETAIQHFNDKAPNIEIKNGIKGSYYISIGDHSFTV